jgi:cytochrome c biogenesis protein
MTETHVRASAGIRPPEANTGPPGHNATPFGIIAWLRWGWRQLTSMRTALILLFLLAVASVPGSVLPQEGADPQKVQQYMSQHPALGPWLNHLSLFNVFAAPWFVAVYALLFISLAGCVLPRTFRLALSVRAKPPAAPAQLGRLPLAARQETGLPPATALQEAERLLSGRRFRLLTGEGWVAAEKGYLREAGNLLFHIALLALLAAIGLGGGWGYKADVIVTEGTGFTNTVPSYDQYHPGHMVSPADLQPFSIWLDSFHASYITSGPLRSQPESFHAMLRYQADPTSPVTRYDLEVNKPLNVDGAKVYLIGHGYAPVFKITDRKGHLAFDQAVPFLAADNVNYTSEGVIKVPDASPQQLGFIGVFLPTAVDQNGQLTSVFPAPFNPVVSLVSYAGDLGEENGAPQSVYQLDTAKMHRLPVAPRPLEPGQSVRLPNGLGTLTYAGVKQYASIAVTYDPGRLPALISAIFAIAGLLLSFLVRRRRVFVRATRAERTTVEIGGLARSDVAGGFEEEFAELAESLRTALASAERQASNPPPAETVNATPPAGGDEPAPSGGREPAPAEAVNPPPPAGTVTDKDGK